MLNKIENKVMNFIYKRTNGKGSLLLSIEDIFIELQNNKHVTLSEVEKILQDLAYDGYIECVNTDKRGQFFFLISLKSKGEAYPREVLSQKRELKRRIYLTLIFAVVSFFVGVILKNIF